MQISWINKFSMIDYPNKVSCIIFTPWCNLRCGFCHNSEFVLPKLIKNNTIIREDDLFSFLSSRKWLLDWVSICGWEPTLQKDLALFCKKIKDLWFAVKLDTNWIKPEVIKELIEKKLVDYIAMDIKNPLDNYYSITWVKEQTDNYQKSINIIKNSQVDYEFRTTVIKWIHKEEDIEDIAKFINWTKAYYLQNYRPWDTLQKDFNWQSFTSWELTKLKQIAEKYISNVDIRS